MPCDTISREKSEQLKRESQMAALEEALKTKSATLAKTGNKLSIEGWDERGGWCDECAFNRLRTSQDFVVRMMAENALKSAGQFATFGHHH